MYHVGSPEMFEGNIFFPLTGTPISNRDCSKMRLADCEPVPFAVALFMVKSFAMVSIDCFPLRVYSVNQHLPLFTVGFAYTP